MSLRDVEDLLAARGVVISYETIRAWVAKFGLQYAKAIRRNRPKVADKWHLDCLIVREIGPVFRNVVFHNLSLISSTFHELIISQRGQR